MLFNSTVYLLVFLPVAFAGYFTLPTKVRAGWLLVASLFFYGWWMPSLLPILLASIAVNFWFGKILRTRKGCCLLACCIALNCAPLVYFKYYNFILDNISMLLAACGMGIPLPTHHYALPLGISFFTFQQIAYLVDCFRGGVREYRFVNYSLFVSFWPQLIAGPIVHHAELLPQFARSNNGIKGRHIYLGLIVFAIGLAKKVLLADQLATVADWGWSCSPTELNVVSAWMVTLCYSLQLYFDFSGYCDMAFGSAMLFNVRLPWNFDSPYKATSIQDFWRRWHITLSRWLRDYLYIPFGGNRKGLPRALFNGFVTFLIGGIWHGAGWTFVLWGIVHGVALSICNVWRKCIRVRVPQLLGRVVTLLVVHFAWVLFRAPSVGAAMDMIRAMCGFGAEPKAVTLRDWSTASSQMWVTYFVLVVSLVILPSLNSREMGVVLTRKFNARGWQISSGIVCGALVFLCLMKMLSRNIAESPFLYFQF